MDFQVSGEANVELKPVNKSVYEDYAVGVWTIYDPAGINSETLTGTLSRIGNQYSATTNSGYVACFITTLYGRYVFPVGTPDGTQALFSVRALVNGVFYEGTPVTGTYVAADPDPQVVIANVTIGAPTETDLSTLTYEPQYYLLGPVGPYGALNLVGFDTLFLQFGYDQDQPLAPPIDDCDPSNYLSLVTVEHQGRPKFISALTEALRPFVCEIKVMASMPGLFDIDVSVGSQEDIDGLWIGRNRYLLEPLRIYFSLDTDGLGFDQGIWKGPFDPDFHIVALDDEPYRVLLKAVIQANIWDGTIPGAYEAWNTLFNGTPYSILIQDYGDMSMAIVLLGMPPDDQTYALFTTGDLNLKPAGVRLYHLLPSDYTRPLFGFDVDNGVIAGFDEGAFALVVLTE